MEKAKNREEFIKEIAELLSCGHMVCYDPDTLSYNWVHEDWLLDYADYLEPEEEAPEQPLNELQDWEQSLVNEIKESLDMPCIIERPSSRLQYRWMEQFVEDMRDNEAFAKEAGEALRIRNPFINFKHVFIRHNMSSEWYARRDECFENYVRNNIILP